MTIQKTFDRNAAALLMKAYGGTTSGVWITTGTDLCSSDGELSLLTSVPITGYPNREPCFRHEVDAVFCAQAKNTLPSIACANIALEIENKELLAALESVVKFAQEAHAKWDADEDVRVGKMLMALAGYRSGYRADTDAIHKAIHNAKSDNAS